MPDLPARDRPASFVEFFADLRDPRLDRRKLHELTDIFVITLCAVLTGAEGWTEIEQFGKIKLDGLRTFLKLENGIPSHDTFGRVFSLIDPDEFGRRFLDWIQTVCLKGEGRIVAIDGKTLRRSYDARSSCQPFDWAYLIPNLCSEEQVKSLLSYGIP